MCAKNLVRRKQEPERCACWVLAKEFRLKATGGDTLGLQTRWPLTAPRVDGGSSPLRRVPAPAPPPRGSAQRPGRSPPGGFPRPAQPRSRYAAGGPPSPYPGLLPRALGSSGKGMELIPQETRRQRSGLLCVGLHGNAQRTQFLPECS